MNVVREHHLSCPSVSLDEVTYTGNGFTPSFGYNANICQGSLENTPTVRGRFIDPTRTMVFAEACSAVYNGNFAVLGQTTSQAVFRHGKTHNNAFMDGHAEALLQEQIHEGNRNHIYWLPYGNVCKGTNAAPDMD